MNSQQPSSGDLKDIQRQRQQEVENKNDVATPTLLERRRSKQSNQSETLVSPMPTGAERMAALRDLGATFEEGQKSIAKVATPTETIVPSFVDSEHLEVNCKYIADIILLLY